ncbi:hypothetical protein D3C86_1729370 [compost metagenome]
MSDSFKLAAFDGTVSVKPTPSLRASSKPRTVREVWLGSKYAGAKFVTGQLPAVDGFSNCEAKMLRALKTPPVTLP